MWPDTIRIIRLVRPRWVLLENVPGLLGRGMSEVLGDLAASGYDAEWQCISAAAVGAPHIRDRVWIVGWDTRRGNDGERCSPQPGVFEGSHSFSTGIGKDVADADRGRLENERGCGIFDKERETFGDDSDRCGSQDVAHPTGPGQLRTEELENDQEDQRGGRRSDISECGQISGEDVADADRERGKSWGGQPRAESIIELSGKSVAYPPSGSEQSSGPQGDVGRFQETLLRESGYPHDWTVEPDVGRVAHGIPKRVDRLRALGNAIVPQVAEWIITAILAADMMQASE
ncbi:hypothetical protein LCGC14_2660160 [marine sediment metagenome]|uniref:DNA (cytosine-5-)-methyltransferase n=1 Tax=marine sediment metagenome TaxID=412755 RepID=A0A0F9C2D2_9ZZZZ